MRPINVAVVQMHPQLAEIEENIIRMSNFIEEICKSEKVDIIIFPELITTGYECGVRFTELAQPVPGYTVGLIAQRAAEFNVHLAFGMVAKHKVESILYDAAVLIGPDGELIGDYHKVHLKGEERLAFRSGYRYHIFETGFGLLGLLIGWDLAFPEAARSLALEGAELICVCANWETPNTEEWHTYVLSRALENTIFVAAANRVGEEYTYSFFGDSMIVGPRGEVYASVDHDLEGYGLARIDLDEVKKYREELQILQCRRPTTYRAIVKKY
ncbi:MAG: carbon-nitrogen hydrolase family protein [Anaerolineae bacterium]